MLFVRKHIYTQNAYFNDEFSCRATLTLDIALCHSNSVRMSIYLTIAFNNVTFCHFN